MTQCQQRNQKPNQMKSIKIISSHKTLAEAVAASNIDLSYNESSARESIKLTDCGYNRDRGTTEAFVCDDGKIRFVYQADIAVLNEFSPFCGCLNDSHFQMVMKTKDELIWTDATIPKTLEGRKAVRNIQSQSYGSAVLVS